MKHNHHGHGALFAMGDLISGITGGDGGWSVQKPYFEIMKTRRNKHATRIKFEIETCLDFTYLSTTHPSLL